MLVRKIQDVDKNSLLKIGEEEAEEKPETIKQCEKGNGFGSQCAVQWRQLCQIREYKFS
jgi:hypothetical protein